MTKRPRSLWPGVIALLLAVAGCNDNDGGGGTSNAIGASGGTVVSSDGLAQVEIPPGALAADVNITIRKTSAPAGTVGTAYEFGPDGTTFALPVRITITYDEADVPAGSTEADLRLGNFTSGAWVGAAGQDIDTVANTVSGETTHFSAWGLVLDALLFPPPAGVPPIVFGTGALEMFVYDSALAPPAGPQWQVNEDGWWPAWRPVDAGVSPTEIAYSGFVGPDSAIKLMNIGGSGGNPIVHFAGRNAFQPAWSPDRNYISFSLATEDGLEAEIWVARSDGANPYRVTQGNYDVRSTWSPNGTMIAFERDGQGIYKVPSNGTSGATPLFTDPMLAPAAPDWSSNRIVFQAYQAPQGSSFYGYRIAVIDESGDLATLRWLTYNGGQIGDYAPKWSPDGAKVLFARETQQSNGIRTVESGPGVPSDPSDPYKPDATGTEASIQVVAAGGSQVLGADW